jgi:uncharacterized protein DUF4157
VSILIGTKFVEKSWQSRNPKAVAGAATPSRGKVLQRKCACGQSAGSGAECEECKKKKDVQRKSAGGSVPATAPPVVHEVLSSPGEPLDSATREFFEPRFGHDFSRVRVHADDRAASSAREINAAAYTVGRNIVFDSNRYHSSTGSGNPLLAHELAHVVQQEAAAPSFESRPVGLRIAPSDDTAEQEAERAARNLGGTALARHEHPVVRRDDKKPGDTKSVPQTPYSKALDQLKTLDPLLHGYLSKAPLNGASTAVRTINATDTSVNPPIQIQIAFNLQVKEVPLAANLDAQFNGGIPVIAGGVTSKTVTANMEMQVNSKASVSLAQALYHEGIHMLLFMDDLVPGGSPHGAALGNYKKIANAHADITLLKSQLTTMIEAGLKQQKLDPSKAPGLASQLLDDVWEEKYVRDQEAAKFSAPFTNRQLAGTQILKDLKDMNITPAVTDVAFQSVLGAATRIMDAIDQQVKSAQPSNPPAQKAPAQKSPDPKK